MTDEPFENVAAQLRRCIPAPLPPSLVSSIRETLNDQRLTPADWALATISSAGAIAAVLIAALTVWQLTREPAPLPAPTGPMARQITPYSDVSLATR